MQFEDWSHLSRLLIVCLDEIQAIEVALQSLRSALPQVNLTLLLCEPGVPSPVLTSVAAVWQYSRRHQDPAEERNLVRRMSAQRFDAALLLTRRGRSPYSMAYLCYLAGIPIRVGHSREFGGGVLSYCVTPPDWADPSDVHLHLLRSVGLSIGSIDPPQLKETTIHGIRAVNNHSTHWATSDRLGRAFRADSVSRHYKPLTSYPMRNLRILTWHVHGSYLYYLTQVPHEFYLPVKPGKPEGYGGRLPNFPWGPNVYDVPAQDVRHLEFDCILFQSRKNYLEDQYEILSESQRRLPRLYLEHDPPREHPTDTHHVVDEPDVLLVHVTDFNHLMWDNRRTPTRVIDHGVIVPESVQYTGELNRGLVVVNGLKARGRRLGVDLFDRVQHKIPLDLVGMGSEQLGGLGEVAHADLPAFAARYRFFFHPVRYTSLGLAVCEAMMAGLPILGPATTELVTVVENGISGYVETNLDRLIQHMQTLLEQPELAHRLSAGAKRQAQQRFSLDRFIRDWEQAFATAIQLVGRETPTLSPQMRPLTYQP